MARFDMNFSGFLSHALANSFSRNYESANGVSAAATPPLTGLFVWREWTNTHTHVNMVFFLGHTEWFWGPRDSLGACLSLPHSMCGGGVCIWAGPWEGGGGPTGSLLFEALHKKTREAVADGEGGKRGGNCLSCSPSLRSLMKPHSPVGRPSSLPPHAT